MERWLGRVALVTGASAGIGSAVAEVLVKHGMKVVGCARQTQQIQLDPCCAISCPALAGRLKEEKGSLHAITCDLTSEDAILAMFQQIKALHGGVDLCVNNAGLNHAAPLLTGATAEWRNILDVNVLALCVCTREAVKSMRERDVDDGHVVHISSLNGYVPADFAYANMYAASKHAVRALTEGLRNELREIKSNIRVSAISPGMVTTEFPLRAIGEEQGKKMLETLPCLSASDIADALVYIVSAPPHVQVHDIVVRPTQQLR